MGHTTAITATSSTTPQRRTSRKKPACTRAADRRGQARDQGLPGGKEPADRVGGGAERAARVGRGRCPGHGLSGRQPGALEQLSRGRSGGHRSASPVAPMTATVLIPGILPAQAARSAILAREPLSARAQDLRAGRPASTSASAAATRASPASSSPANCSAFPRTAPRPFSSRSATPLTGRWRPSGTPTGVRCTKWCTAATGRAMSSRGLGGLSR